jgi:hypothetical protein
MQGVYLFGNRELGWFKIGKSRNIENRFKDLCCVLPFPIEQIEIFKCDDPGFVEVQLHRHFASKRMRGEWFRLDEHDLASWCIMAPRLAQRTNFRKRAASLRKGERSKKARARAQRSRESKRLSTLSNQASR